jgi:integrase
MSRASTGTVAWRPNAQSPGTYCWHARYTRADKSRTPWYPLDPGIVEHDEEAARRCALQFASDAKATTRDGVGESLSAYSIRWLASRPKKTAKDNASHLRHHVLPVIGNVSILRLTSTHGDELVAALDRTIAAGSMSDKSARNVWATAKRMVKDAAHAKPSTGLRCLDANPFRDVMPPERVKTRRAKNFLYQSEFLDLVSCRAVPPSWKGNVAIAVFIGVRDSEQRALRWEHVDLEYGIINVCEVFDRTSKSVREGTKTDAGRTVPIPAPLLPLLASMHEAGPRLPRHRQPARHGSGPSNVAPQVRRHASRALRGHDRLPSHPDKQASVGLSGSPDLAVRLPREPLGRDRVDVKA